MAKAEFHAKSDYQETTKDIEETFGFVPGYLEALPEEDLVNEWPTLKKYTVGETEIPGKYRELIGLAVAANIKCPYCEQFHREAAKLHGASDEELTELVSLASFTSRWSTMIHAQHYDQETFDEETERIAAHLTEAAAQAEDSAESMDDDADRPSAPNP